MINIVAHNYVKVEKTDEFIALAKQLVQETREKDAGCIRYELMQDTKNPQHLTMFEAWENQESLEKHMKSQHFQEAMKVFTDFMEMPAEVQIFNKLA